MIIDVDRAATSVTVVEPDVLDAFSARSDTTDDAVVGEAMGPAGHAAGDAHVWVDAAWVRSQVGDSAGPDWVERFDQMVAYAASKGWTDEAGTHIKAHIELRY
jgi:hypothetical protein